MKGHDFNFEGGEYLARMGASWFVSYAYYLSKDNSHDNWQCVNTYISRRSVFNRTKQYHTYWLNEVLKMSDKKLNTNTIGLNASQTKQIAKKLLEHKSGE